jgi:ankyrin repeat protein
MPKNKYARIDIDTICFTKEISADVQERLIKKFSEGTIKTEYIKAPGEKAIYAIRLNQKERCFALLEEGKLIIIAEDLEHKFDIDYVMHRASSYTKSQEDILASSQKRGAIIDGKLIIYNKEQEEVLGKSIEYSGDSSDSEESSAAASSSASYASHRSFSPSNVKVKIINGMPGSGKTMLGYDILQNAQEEGKKVSYITKSTFLTSEANRLLMSKEASTSDDEASASASASDLGQVFDRVAYTYDQFTSEEMFKYLERFLAPKGKTISNPVTPDEVRKFSLGEKVLNRSSEELKYILDSYRQEHIATFETFEKWAKSNSGIKTLLSKSDIESYRDLYQEMQKECLSGIGRKSTKYVNLHNDGIIKSILVDYKAYLEGRELLDVSLLYSGGSSKEVAQESEDSAEAGMVPETVVVIDEAQNFSPSELCYVLKKFPTNATIYILKDGDQSLVDPYNITDNAIRSCYPDQSNILSYELTTSHRAPLSITSFGQKILEIKDQLLGISSKRAQGYKSIEDEGCIEFFSSEEFLKQTSPSMLADFTNTVVIIFDQGDRQKAEEKFKGSLVLLPEEVIGLEYQNVVLYDPFNFHNTSITKKVQSKLDGIKLQSSQEPIEACTTRSSAHNPKNPDDIDLALPMNRLYVSCTRSTKNLYIISDCAKPKQKPIEKKFLELLQPTREGFPVSQADTKDIKLVESGVSFVSLEKAVDNIIELKHAKVAFEKSVGLLLKRLGEYKEGNQEKIKQLSRLQEESGCEIGDLRKQIESLVRIETPVVLKEVAVASSESTTKAPAIKAPKKGAPVKEVSTIKAPAKVVTSAASASRDTAPKTPLQSKDDIIVKDLHSKIYDRKTETHVKQFIKEKRIGESILNMHASNPEHGHTSLTLAVLGGDVEIVKLLINKGADVNKPNLTGDSALHLATLKGNAAMVELLINKGAGLNILNSKGDHALHLAAGEGNAAIVKLLIDKGVTVDIKDSKGNTALHFAAVMGNAEIVELLIAKGADLDKEDLQGNTALHIAAGEGRAEIVELLINKGADLNRQDSTGSTALHVAAGEGKVAIVKLLIDKGAALNIQNLEGETALHVAAGEGNAAIVELLIAKGADIDIKDNQGKTPLDLAVEMGDRDMLITLLVENAKHLGYIDARKEYALHLAVKSGNNKAIVELLKDESINKNEFNEEGKTVLHLAVERCGIEIVKSIIHFKVNLTMRDDSGKAALHLAVERGDSDIVKCLVENGAPLDRQTSQASQGNTALHLAASKGNTAIVKLLIESGADLNITNSEGLTALELAQLNGHDEIVTLLSHDQVDKEGTEDSQHLSPVNDGIDADARALAGESEQAE